MNFADRIFTRIETVKSAIVAGFDPRPDTIPEFFHAFAARHAQTNEDYIFKLLTEFHGFCLAIIHEQVAAVKPNVAFFEALGIPGLRAFKRFCEDAKSYDLPIIADAKRGDIGSTAQAYSSAFLGRSNLHETSFPVFDVDALTVNPFLGFDTLEPFIADCAEYGKGLFVLVKTSNPGSSEIQTQKLESGETISEIIANWVAEQAKSTIGTSGFSPIGAVVGATYPQEARALRERMPHSFFLIPGLGAQGGSAADAMAGFSAAGTGGLINISRGLFSSFSSSTLNRELATKELKDKLTEYNSQIAAAQITKT